MKHKSGSALCVLLVPVKESPLNVTFFWQPLPFPLVSVLLC